MESIPTKKNLLSAKQHLILAKKGYELLDKKYTALLHEITQHEKRVRELRERVARLFAEAENTLAVARCFSSFFDNGYGEWQRALGEQGIPYSMKNTCAELDIAIIAQRQFLRYKEILTKEEEILAQLKARAVRTKKRAAALDKTLIPKYITRIKYISAQLEEHERHEVGQFRIHRKRRHMV
ncbi:MAG: V-type ATP synthase subunit D [Defluviitaleaceae bacterium]|nr:V-type ATP synthase subunit D [Defluviitaleaceae bacterium]